MFTVQGYIDQVSYAVEVGQDDDSLGGYKISAGSPSALGVLRAYDGDQVAVHAVGEDITADAGTPEGVLAILTAHTEVTDVAGDDVPDLLGPEERGRVY